MRSGATFVRGSEASKTVAMTRDSIICTLAEDIFVCGLRRALGLGEVMLRIRRPSGLSLGQALASVAKV